MRRRRRSRWRWRFPTRIAMLPLRRRVPVPREVLRSLWEGVCCNLAGTKLVGGGPSLGVWETGPWVSEGMRPDGAGTDPGGVLFTVQ
jgi:hypothetical protein